MTFILTTSILSLLTLFISLISAAPMMGGGFGGFGRAAIGGFGRAAIGGFGRAAIPYGYGMGFNRAFNNFAAYPYGYGMGFNQFNAFPYGMGFNRVNSVGDPPCDECYENSIKDIPVYVNNMPPMPPPSPAPVIYNEIPAQMPSPPPVVVNDIMAPPPQAPPTIMNNLVPNPEPNLPPTVMNNVPPPPPKPMPPMVVNNNVAECECDECGCDGGNAEFVQQDVEYVEQPAVAYMPLGTTSIVQDVNNDFAEDGVVYGGVGGQSIVYP